MNELIKRTISGAIFVSCVIGSILYSPYAFGAILLIIILLAVNEFHHLTGSGRLACGSSIVASLLLWAATEGAVLPHDKVAAAGWGIYALIGVVYILIIIGTMIDELWQKEEQPLRNWGNLLISQAMIAVPLCSMAFLNSLDKWLLLALFVLIWTNDTGAYCVGVLTAKRAEGNHKMFPRVSPKKSWEGLIGGIIFALAGSVLLAYFGWFDRLVAAESTTGRYIIALVFGALVCCFGTLGDLMESLLKRSIGVKDSGKFLPGHGGVLDRFDSVLLAAPVLTIFCWICYAFSSLG